MEAVKLLWKQKRKRLILSRAGSGSELGSVKLQEELEAEALKI